MGLFAVKGSGLVTVDPVVMWMGSGVTTSSGSVYLALTVLDPIRNWDQYWIRVGSWSYLLNGD